MERKKAIFTIPKVYTNNHYLWDGGRVEDGWSSLSVYIKGIGSTGDDAVDASDFFTGTYGGQTYTWWLGFGGNDYVNAFHNGTKGWFQGGSGTDTISYYDASAGVQIFLDSKKAHYGTGPRSTEDHISGFEHVIGSHYNDFIVGDDGANRLEGNPGNDFLYGRGGDDLLFGGSGDDHLLGQDGNDTLIGGAGADTLDGGAGTDWASYENAGRGVITSLKGVQYENVEGDAAGDTYRSIENLLGSAHDDHLVGDDGANHIKGGVGNDYIESGVGNDTLEGGAGYDRLIGGEGNDVMTGGAGDDRLVGGGGNDVMTGGTGADTFVLGFTQLPVTNLIAVGGHDTITDFENGVDTFRHAAGDDVDMVAVQDGTSVKVTWGSSNSSATFLNADVSWSVFSSLKPEPYPEPEVTPDPEPEAEVTPEPAPDQEPAAPKPQYKVIKGNGNNNSLAGTNGRDSINGYAGNDKIIGRKEDDIISGGSGDDSLIGNTGNDTLRGNRGDDTLTGGHGDDVLSGGTDADTFVFSSGHGNDTITDFADGVDLIQITTSGVGFDDLTLADSSGDAKVTWNGGTITLNGVAHTALTAEDFILPEAEVAPKPEPGPAPDQEPAAPKPPYKVIKGNGNNNSLTGTNGRDSINGYAGNDKIIGRKEDDIISGGSGDDSLIGNTGNDTLRGNLGDDTLIGGHGDDVLTGGTNADTFVFSSGHGNDTITDFEDGVDLIQITASGVGFDDLAIADDGSDAIVTWDGGSILLTGVAHTALTADDFVF